MDLWDNGWALRLRDQMRKMWVRVVLGGLAGLVLALASRLIGPFLPNIPEINLASGSVDSLLSIIASSMLAVTTFSMSIIITAYGSAAQNATPRATRLLERDQTAQTAVAIFIGSFLFSIAGIIGLSAGLYPGDARVVLFAATLADIALIAWALLRWVSHLNDFGRMRDIIGRIEDATMPPARLFRERPALGAVPGRDVLPKGLPELRSNRAGHVRFIDMKTLQDCAEENRIRVEILRMPGKYVHRGEALLRLSAPVSHEMLVELRGAFTIRNSRSFDQDPLYGLIVLAEVASKSLSPAINDPGTAIEVLRAGTRVLEALHDPHPPEDEEAEDGKHGTRHDRVYAPPLSPAEVYATFFGPIARDGAGLVEVQEAVQDCLAAVALIGDPAAARVEAERARIRARSALSEEWELDRLASA
ncbi:DUF2254 domain-containing protein [Paracoccus jeotgali]|uniref:DUF2254 domain-containing protein n=1 Tax=Paracoccus jeotgali TaxID=2065379 RepID=A0A2K9MKT7_9RHOB|nr:DUF2254 domain-containing protein [Paracoccus jeotgali]AUM75225.1 DUF2254 domain-containing protein [Paracoccus jeotgali]